MHQTGNLLGLLTPLLDVVWILLPEWTRLPGHYMEGDLSGNFWTSHLVQDSLCPGVLLTCRVAKQDFAMFTLQSSFAS